MWFFFASRKPISYTAITVFAYNSLVSYDNLPPKKVRLNVQLYFQTVRYSYHVYLNARLI
ncbi:hypothetical protein VCHA38O209_170052 [Vibrio chagasii]|nr:hypothetical protein VCHA31O73_250049 [Vibrio chagasii]CAH6881119.1 hypothetical protein VCHA34O109_250019 [Vibrio chagasii]CAH7124313.1 hypothetical protein VCHA43P273_230050 [Vibrio chagasii]CAH7158348.1 hypothetical protein VCHA53O480_270019 [Vibrio chagasii]CAH7240900.1 hypothetical protein VCHA38O209_170052 [Vibrio chagasii]